MKETEYTGQLIGGPDDDNIITAQTERVHFEYQCMYWLDSQFDNPTVTRIKGEYVWNTDPIHPKQGTFIWHRRA